MRRKSTSTSTDPPQETQFPGPSIIEFPEMGTGVKEAKRYRRSGFYVLPPSDIHVTSVSVPGVHNRDLRDFLHYRLRSLYPGGGDLTAFDFLLNDSGPEPEAFVCVCRSDVLTRHYAEAGNRQIVVPLSLIVPQLSSYRGGKLAYLYCAESAVEIDLFENGSLRNSRVFSAAVESEADRSELWALFDEFGPEHIVCIPQKAEEPVYREIHGQLLTLYPDVTVIDLATALKAVGKSGPLFQVRRRRNTARFRTVAALLTLVVLFLGVVNIRKADLREEAHSGALAAQLTSVREKQAQAAELAQEVTGLKATLEALETRPFADPFALLSDLTAVLAGNAAVDSYFQEGRFFQIEAVARDPLALVQRFEQNSRFRDLRITQVVQSSTDGEKRFTLTGEYGEE